MSNPICPSCGGELVVCGRAVTYGILYECLECERSWTDEQLDLYDAEEEDEEEEYEEEEDERHGDDD